MIRTPANEAAYTLEAPQSSVDWLRDYVKSAWWEPLPENLDVKTEYFDATKRSPNTYTCWRLDKPRLEKKVVLARRPVNINAYEYLLINNGKIHRLDPFLKELGEHRRIMLSLRRIEQNPVFVQVKHFKDHVHFKTRTYLPARETQLFEQFAWPCNSFNDRLEWDMPIQTWNYISPFISALGIEVKEAPNG